MTRSSPRAPTRALYIAVTLTLAACQDGGELASPAAPSLSDAFVPVYRQTPSDVMERRQALTSSTGATGITEAPGQDFYLAIHKKELGSRWFMAAYLTQAAPQGEASGAARSLGTRVVSFKVQNGKLFVFDAGDHNASSDPFRPELLLEAYPIVQGYGPFERQKGSSDYVLFDPAAGLNRFRLLPDAGAPLEVDLSFSQRFRKVSDGATFEQVFSGTTRTAPQPGSVPGRVTGTLSLALRRYAEGEGYTEVAMPAREHYFRSPSRIIVDEGRTGFVAARWNIKPGGRPSSGRSRRWARSCASIPRSPTSTSRGRSRPASRAGTRPSAGRRWRPRLADPDESFGDDDVNYYIFDSLRSTASAFANWRSNPNTGEIRGASVWFALGWLRATMDFAALRRAGAGRRRRRAVGAVVHGGALSDDRRPAALAWGTASDESLCDLTWPDLDEVLAEGDAPFTRKERSSGWSAHIAAHEIGHTLGLRHNFKGSLLPLSSSVMEYIDIADSITFGARIGSYDIAAIRYLYGLSNELPPQPFCNDQDADVVDPDCRRRDQGARPLSDFFLPLYQGSLQRFLAAGSNSLLAPGNLTPHIRLAASPAVRLEAYQGTFGPLRAQPLPPDAHPSFVPRLNAVTQLALRQLFLDMQPGQTVPAGQPAPGALPPSTPVVTAAIADLHPLLVNADGLRFASTRRLVVDVLKRFQHPAAFAALEEARAQIAAVQGELSGVAAVENKDLLNRIDRALASYFD